MNDATLDERARLLSALIGGEPTLDESARINRLMRGDEAFRRAYLERVEVHALLAWQFHAAQNPLVRRAPLTRISRATVLRWAAACLIVAGTFAYFFMRGESASAACARLIRANETLGDRTYRISADYPPATDTKNSAAPFDPKRAPLPTLDGATLDIGSGDRFVLTRTYSNGEPLIVGYNGSEGWAIRGQSAVRVSARRFRGDVPGSEQGVPFTDMRSNLNRLQTAYDIETLAPQKLNEQSAGASRRLRGVRRSREFRGPQSVEIFYDDESGVIQRMIFDRLPQQNGGPVRATLDLIAQPTRDPAWYDNSAHHEPGRPVDRRD